ncbi:MAG: DUF6048 family protein [Microscillaceae bacterium]|nr:DUF6048 family protein [Microscillaceae bacterium]
MFLSKIKSAFFLIVLSILVLHQVSAQDTTSIKNESMPRPPKNKDIWKIKGFRVGLDLVPPLIFAFDQDFRNLEASGELILGNRFFLTADLGIDRTIRQGDSHRYQSSGSYFRVGMDYNLWHKNKSGVGAIFSLGLHLGLASFKHSLVYSVNSAYWEPAEGELTVGGLSASWLEIKSGLKAKIAPNLYMGPIARMRIGFSSRQSKGLEIHDIPGFGLNIPSKIRVGYQLLYQIPFSKKK